MPSLEIKELAYLLMKSQFQFNFCIGMRLSIHIAL